MWCILSMEYDNLPSIGKNNNIEINYIINCRIQPVGIPHGSTGLSEFVNFFTQSCIVRYVTLNYTLYNIVFAQYQSKTMQTISSLNA